MAVACETVYQVHTVAFVHTWIERAVCDVRVAIIPRPTSCARARVCTHVICADATVHARDRIALVDVVCASVAAPTGITDTYVHTSWHDVRCRARVQASRVS